MQSVFVIITKLIASNKYFCKEVFCNNFGRDGSVHRTTTHVPEKHARLLDQSQSGLGLQTQLFEKMCLVNLHNAYCLHRNYY